MYSLKTMLSIGEQMISRIETLHSYNFMHRDYKPSNFAIGLGEQSNKIYIIDLDYQRNSLIKLLRYIKNIEKIET